MNKKRKKVFLHIGLCKTGTSAIQSTLQNLQDNGELCKIGFQYHDCNKLFYLHCEKLCFPDEEQYIGKLFRDEIYTYVKNNNEELQENIIISQEILSLNFDNNNVVFSSAHAEFLSRVLSKYDVKVIIYLRRQDNILESLYAHWIKIGMLSKEAYEKKELRHSLFYKKILDEYAKFFGKENIIARLYDKDFMYKSDTISDFFSVIGICDMSIPSLIKSQKNLSFSPEALRIRYAFNSEYGLSEEEKNKTLHDNKLSYFSGKIDRKKCVYKNYYVYHGQNFELEGKYSHLRQMLALEKVGNFSNSGFMKPDERREFLAQYEEDNAAIAREYLGREDGKLFNDTFPKNIISLNEPSTTDLVTIFLPIFNDLHLRLQHAENQLESVERRLKYIKAPWKFILMYIKKFFDRVKRKFLI